MDKIKYNIILSLLCFSILLACKSKVGIPNKNQLNNFSNEERVHIRSGSDEDPMRVFIINNQADSVLLRSQSSDVVPDSTDLTLDHFIKRLYRTVRDSMSLGVGIAAPQVGILKNIIWVQRFDKESFPFEVYLNPKILKYSNLKQDCLEGCLSIPDRSDTTKTRAYAILIEYDKPDESHHLELVEDFTAVIFQHEIDHLNGILYLDHLEAEIKQGKTIKK